ncbi:MAG: hypothetical protein J5365_03600 [Erysipelotrichaceae bacterium]|nr:hypothetical protein [Erysipelotrichaceae bacterium]
MKKILCYGDSNTWGYIPGTGERYSEDVRWPCICRKELGSEFMIIEDGINGRTTCYEPGWGDAKNGREGLSYALLANYPLDGVVIMLGSNDLTIHDTAFAKKGNSELLRIIKNANQYFRTEVPVFPEGVKILLIAPPLIGESDDPSFLYSKASEESRKFAKYYRDLADEYKVDYLNAAEYAKPSDIDHIHLTVESHLALGKAVAEKLKEMYR